MPSEGLKRSAWSCDPRSWPYWLTLLLVPALCAAGIIWTLPFAMPMPSYWTDAVELARTGIIQQRFTPSGYPLTMSLGVWLFPAHPDFGYVLEQAAVHLCLAVALWAVMRRLGASARAALVGAMLLQADPELLTSIMKVWDVALSTLLLLLLAVTALRVLQRGATFAASVLMGGVWAYGCFDRPNYVSLLPALLFALWCGGRARRVGAVRFAGLAVALVCSGAIVYAACSTVTYRQVRTPGNGPYNLFAGNNPYTRGALLEHLNAEPSIVPALRAAHVDMTGRTPDAVSLQPFYRQSSREFALQNPGAESGLIWVKLLTLLRPDTKVHPANSFPGVGKVTLSLFVPAWLLTILAVARRRRDLWCSGDVLIALSAVLYVLPFLVTNADPRFRTPLDLLLAAHIVSLGSRWNSGPSRAEAVQ